MIPEELSQLNVILLEPSILKDVSRQLTLSRRIGLSIITERNAKPVVVCMTLEESIYVIQPNIEDDINFLREQLARNDLTFYSVNGTWEADLFKNYMNIDLIDNIDLVCLDIFLSLRWRMISNLGRNRQYSVAFVEEYLRPKKLDYKDLLTKYCRMDIDLSMSVEELNAIIRNPLDPVSKLTIQRYSGPIRSLALAMISKYETLRDGPTKCIYRIAKVSDTARQDYDMRSDNSYSHLTLTIGNSTRTTESIEDILRE